jgi:hypothetical protein
MRLWHVINRRLRRGNVRMKSRRCRHIPPNLQEFRQEEHVVIRLEHPGKGCGFPLTDMGSSSAGWTSTNSADKM